MVAAPDVGVAVHLEHVTELAIDHEAADRPARVVVQLKDLGGIAVLLDQLLERELDRKALELVLVIERQRVVHVEPDHLDRVHPEIAIAEHAVLARDVDLRRGLAEQRADRGIELGNRRDHLYAF